MPIQRYPNIKKSAADDVFMLPSAGIFKYSHQTIVFNIGFYIWSVNLNNQVALPLQDIAWYYTYIAGHFIYDMTSFIEPFFNLTKTGP